MPSETPIKVQDGLKRELVVTVRRGECDVTIVHDGDNTHLDVFRVGTSDRMRLPLDHARIIVEAIAAYDRTRKTKPKWNGK